MLKEQTSSWPVALTFDVEHPDRPAWGNDTLGAILSVIRRQRVQATFFLQGRWVEACPDAARRIVDLEQRLGNHSYFHADLRLMSARGLKEDVIRSEEAIFSATGASPRPYFRCPFGYGARSHRIVDVLSELGYMHVPWTVSANDWRPEQTAKGVVREIVSSAASGAIIVMHSWSRSATAGLDGVVRELRKRGAEFVSLNTLMPEDLSDGRIGGK